MKSNDGKAAPSVGFLTVIENAEWGFVGGLLLLNAAARPTEFHCTSPIRPNRAQEILYGATLRPFVCGEQIGLTLLSKLKCEILFLCTDVEATLSMRGETSVPMLLVTSTPSSNTHNKSTADSSKQRILRFDDPQTSVRRPYSQPINSFDLGGFRVATLSQYSTDASTIQGHWSQFDGLWDLNEPFQRVREALEEAQRGAVK